MRGRGVLYGQRSSAVRHCGVRTRTDAGMSSESRVKTPATEYPRFPLQRFSSEG
jgi:hypothetical protein